MHKQLDIIVHLESDDLTEKSYVIQTKISLHSNHIIGIISKNNLEKFNYRLQDLEIDPFFTNYKSI